MKKFILRLGCFAAIQLAIVLLILWKGKPDRGDHYLSSMFDKHRLLVNTTGRRLIVVGGSNVAFGINSEILGSHPDYLPVNLGLHASLGLIFPLKVVEEEVRQGDVVVLSPEYSNLITDNVYGSEDYITLMCQQWPNARQYFGRDNPTDLKTLLDKEGLWHAHLWLRRARRKMLGQDKRSPIYCRSGFNEHGDMVAHYKIPRSQPPDTYALPNVSEEHLRIAVERMNQFHRHCRARGADVVFSYAPVPQEVLLQSRDVIEHVERTFRELLTIPTISDPGEVAYGRDYFYDFMYHLTRQGAASRSQLLVARLKPHLDNMSLRSASAPSRPLETIK